MSNKVSTINIFNKSVQQLEQNINTSEFNSWVKPLSFDLKENNIRISNLFFRDKNLSIDAKGNLFFKPFFQLNLSSKLFFKKVVFNHVSNYFQKRLFKSISKRIFNHITN